MEDHYGRNLTHFFCVGINYKRSDAALRGQFAVGADQYQTLLNNAAQAGLHELFVLSTCNRTELYGFATTARQLIELLCSVTTGSADVFCAAAYIKVSNEAVQHLFAVGAGLDSQILGDYEIVGQLKTAVRFAKEKGFVGAFTERLINCVLQASKNIKQKTALSGGTVSVSFAAVQALKQKTPNLATKNILLLGTGKIGRNTCKNLIDYTGARNITLINRSAEKAEELALALGIKSMPYTLIPAAVQAADVVIVATGAEAPVIHAHHVADNRQRIIIDLSVPCNVEAAVAKLPNITLINVDELSQLKDETLKQRQKEVPKAMVIIDAVMQEFLAWQQMRKHAPLLKNLKLKLKELHSHSVYSSTGGCPKKLDTHIQKVINDTAGKIKIQDQRGCQYIAALNNFISAKN